MPPRRCRREVLIERAGAAVAWAALRMLGGAYGRTVNVMCGKGNNGADGRVAARHLAAKGVRVRVFDVAVVPLACCRHADLVIDAAYGTGFHGSVDTARRRRRSRAWRSTCRAASTR